MLSKSGTSGDVGEQVPTIKTPASVAGMYVPPENHCVPLQLRTTPCPLLPPALPIKTRHVWLLERVFPRLTGGPQYRSTEKKPKVLFIRPLFAETRSLPLLGG